MAEPAHDLPPDIPTGKLLGKADLVTLSEFAGRRAAKLGKSLDTLNAGIEARAADAADSLARAGFDPKDQQAAADKARAKARTEVMANSSDSRWSDLRELVAAADGLALTESLYASPQAVLARAGLGDPRRTDLLKQLSGAGPAELRQMAALAVATKDAVLGAVLQTVNDRLPRRDRPISSAQLAAALVGEETRAVQAAVARIKTTVQRAIVANRDFERGRASALDKVKLALKQKETN